MKYNNVYVEAFAHTFPEIVVTTDELEERLKPLYERLRLQTGRLELMTGIKERRLWPAGRMPGQCSVRTAQRLVEATGVDPARVGMFIHASVCRDYQEPATATGVHHALGLSQHASVFDVSNACLGLLTGSILIANAIELGQIDAGIVVGTENSRALFETTIAKLNGDTTLSRADVKRIFASLTIGSGSSAILLVNEKLTRTGNRLVAGEVQANTDQCHLCRSEIDVSAGGRADGQFMYTDSETLMHRGIETAQTCFDRLQDDLRWSADEIDRVFCHQVGKAHERLLFQTLKLDTRKNFVTLPWLGNTGTSALPTAAAVGTSVGFVKEGDRVMLMGIGSGINVVMLGIEWHKTCTAIAPEERELVDKIRAINA